MPPRPLCLCDDDDHDACLYRRACARSCRRTCTPSPFQQALAAVEAALDRDHTLDLRPPPGADPQTANAWAEVAVRLAAAAREGR